MTGKVIVVDFEIHHGDSSVLPNSRATEEALLAREKLERTQASPFLPSLCCNIESARILTREDFNASMSPSSTKRPVSPFRTASGIPPEIVPTTGLANAAASRKIVPKPSTSSAVLLDGITTTPAEAYLSYSFPPRREPMK